jgi:hypothetical protein
VLQKRMFKVITPIERRDGGKFWARCGSAFTNKDDSINVYLDVMPLGKDATLQLRELTEDDLRERDQKRAAYASRSALTTSSGPALPSTAADGLPF